MEKRKRHGLMVVALSLLVALTIAGSIYLVASHNSDKKTANQPCPASSRKAHKVTIQNGVVKPSHTTAERCDSLTVTNLDDTNRLMAFGVHDSHTTYDGIEEQLLGKGKSLSVTLTKTGNFKFHDHLHDDVQGTFTVK